MVLSLCLLVMDHLFCSSVDVFLNPDPDIRGLKIVVSYTLLIIKGNLNWFQYIIL